jgi:hypothetical protein
MSLLFQAMRYPLCESRECMTESKIQENNKLYTLRSTKRLMWRKVPSHITNDRIIMIDDDDLCIADHPGEQERKRVRVTNDSRARRIGTPKPERPQSDTHKEPDEHVEARLPHKRARKPIDAGTSFATATRSKVQRTLAYPSLSLLYTDH